jgi:hypothetical protein
MCELDRDTSIRLELLKEQGADLRARTQAEYLYTAGALALFGGVCWGIPPQQSCGSRVLFAIGVVIVATLISWKIVADHEAYRTIWIARRINIGELDPGEPPHLLFPELNDNELSDNQPRGRRWFWVEWLRGLTRRLNATYLGPNTHPGPRGEPGSGFLISIIIVFAAALLAAIYCLLRT